MPRFGRGRWRCRRWITALPAIPYFQPFGIPPSELKIINLTPEELEALRLVDLEGLYQDEAAAMMGVSRKTLWADLKRARKKVANALVNGYAIRIAGGNYAIRPQPPHMKLSFTQPPISPKIDDDIVREIFLLLPKTNCGACGYSSCLECAEAIVAGDSPPDACNIIDSKAKDEIKRILERRR